MDPARLQETILSRTPLRNRALRKRLVHGRRRLYEAAGSTRYSCPAHDDLDQKLQAYLPERGVFFEAGANDGYTWSNTYYLERVAGWRGVLVEAIPSLSEECRRLRRYSTVHNCALVPDDYAAAHVTMKYSDLRSLIKGSEPRLEAEADMDPLVRTYEIQAPARTINDVLAASGVGTLDFVSLDLEGFEAPALKGLDLDRYEPTWMLVEVAGGGGRQAVERVIGESYEAITEFGANDVLYRRRQARHDTEGAPSG